MFLNFILLGKGMMIRVNIGRNTSKKKGDGMIMSTMERQNSMRSGKNNFMFEEDILEVRMHRACLICMNRMELRNNTGIAFPEEFSHAMGTDDLRRTNYETLELIPLSLMLELHG
jgi:hypothetical protein